MSVAKPDTNDRCDMQLKILLVGDSGVGKTCLLLRYANNTFSPKFITTIGIDYKNKHIALSNKRLKLQIWDTAGQDGFRTITTSYFNCAQGMMLLYDVTDKNSFISVRNWLAQIQMYADDRVIKIIVGSKCDIRERAVSWEEGASLAAEYGLRYFEISNKCNINVEEVFVELSKMVHELLCSDPTADFERVRRFLDRATDLRITGAKSWYNKHKINGRYIPEGSTLQSICYRNIDTPNTRMVFKTDNSWVVVKNNKELAKLKTTGYQCLPHIASHGRDWTENYGVYFTRMHVQPTMRCVKLVESNKEGVRARVFDLQNHRESINMDLFLEYSKEPERIGLTVPLFAKYSYIQVAHLELQFHSLRREGAADLVRMQELSTRRHDIEHTSKILFKSLALLGDNTPLVEPTAESILRAIVSLQAELVVYFDQLSDLNNGNFEAARRCRDTQAELAEIVLQLKGKDGSTVSAGADAVLVPVCEAEELLSSEPSGGATMAEPSVNSRKVDGALISPISIADDTLAGVAGNSPARRIVQDAKNEWSCRIDNVGWMPVHERENRTTMEIEWRCTVTMGLSNTKSTKVGAALTAGMSTICAQLSLDMNWSSSACKQTEHAHTFKIPPNTKLIVEQEIIEGLITLTNNRSIWAVKSKTPKSESFKVAKDSLRIQSVGL